MNGKATAVAPITSAVVQVEVVRRIRHTGSGRNLITARRHERYAPVYTVGAITVPMPA